ncbi:MAG: hypothetical protein GY945_07905 [Rhodobacteraceae bacterium]|nr:hypothetical protein [Paracoccaceae bacterium]
MIAVVAHIVTPLVMQIKFSFKALKLVELLAGQMNFWLERARILATVRHCQLA